MFMTASTQTLSVDMVEERLKSDRADAWCVFAFFEDLDLLFRNLVMALSTWKNASLPIVVQIDLRKFVVFCWC